MNARAAPPPDTIAAIATPPGRGGIGIVRISGAGVDAVIAGIVGKPLVARTATLTTFRDAAGAALDEGLALYFPAPHSYTGESVVELHGHGGPAVLRLLLARAVELGARLAAPGEFTQRAFLNGRLDLAQAESVADLIDASTATAARAAARSLSGEFSREVHAIVDALTNLRMYTEATLDFPDEDIEFIRAGDAGGKLAAIVSRVDRLLTRASAGALLRDGLSVVLIGRPNVGKSSLLNRLVREEAAIVTAIAGTTRDTVARQVEIAGIPLSIVDTAGLRDAHDEVERIGIARTWAAVEQSDLAVLIVDAREATDTLDAADRGILARLPAALPRIVVHNKGDLAAITAHGETRTDDRGIARRHLWLSALTGDGVELLEREVLAIVGAESATEDTFLARTRHVVALRDAERHLAAAGAHVAAAALPIELFAEELRAAQQSLVAITGEFTADDLLGAIFSRFCIGK